MRVHGNLAPEEYGHAGLGAALLEDATGVRHAVLVLREEEHRHAVIALIGQDMATALRDLAEKVVRHLEQDAGTVAGVLLQAGSAAVLKVDQDGKGVVQYLVTADAVQVGQGADTAGVVLELRAIESHHASPLLLYSYARGQATGAQGPGGVWYEVRSRGVVAGVFRNKTATAS